MSLIQKKGLITQVGSGGGTSDHTALSNRDAVDQHPMSAITGLTTTLAGKQSTITVSTTAPVSPVVNQLWLDIT